MDPGESARQPFNTIWPLLQQNATAKIFVARAEPKLRDMNHIKKGLLCQNKSPFYANEFKACKKPDKKSMGKGGSRYIQNLHLANPRKSLSCTATSSRVSTSVWKMWTTHFVFYDTPLVGLIWQYFLSGDTFTVPRRAEGEASSRRNGRLPIM